MTEGKDDMTDKIFLQQRLYEAMLDMTRLPESQLIMLLENPVQSVVISSLWKALMTNPRWFLLPMIYGRPKEFAGYLYAKEAGERWG